MSGVQLALVLCGVATILAGIGIGRTEWRPARPTTRVVELPSVES